MPIIPLNTNPLQGYVTPGDSPAMTVDGIVVDKVYAFTGVIDTINSNSLTTYQDPTTNQISQTGQVNLPYGNIGNPPWLSPTPVDDVYNTGYSLSFNFNRTTFINYVSFEILNFPCTWTLSQVNTSTSTSTVLYSNTITDYNGNWLKTSAIFTQTYQFDSQTNLVLTINKLPTNTQYTLGLRNLLAKLQVMDLSDLNVNNTTISGFTVQNTLGFIEDYTLKTDPYSNMLGVTVSGVQQYWKCSPQPVKDAIVYFIVDLGYIQTINKMFLDPLYTGNVLNVYYSNDSINWTPIPKDMTLKRGIYDLPQINARYIKLEITQLTAQPYDLPFDSVQRTIDVFPDWVDSYFITLEQALLNSPSQNFFPGTTNPNPNVNYYINPSTQTNYGLAVNQLSFNTYGSPNTNASNNLGAANFGVNNSSYTITDPTTSYKSLEDISNLGSVFANVDATTFINRRFYATGPHQYKQVTINQTWHQAYFAGIKQLYFYCFDPLIQNDNEDYSDYFLTVNASGNSYTPSANTLINTVSGTTATLISGGGYSGLAGTTVQTQNIQTVNQFKSFKFAAFNTDWQSFLSNTSTLLLGPTTQTNITISGINFSNVYPAVDTSNVNYGIYTISGSPGTTSLQTANGGGTNLLTSAEANFTTGGWSGGPTVINTSISGLTLVQIPLLTTTTWDAAYAESPYAYEGYGASAIFGQQQNQYDFLVTASGNGSVTITVNYQNSSGVTVSGGLFTQTTIISGTTNLNFLTTQPLNSSQVAFELTTSGTVTFSQAGFFYGYTSNWVSPIITKNMRVSAVARIYLPNSSKGTYTCGLYASNGTLLAKKSFKNIPLQTWVDIEVPYTLPNTGTNTEFYAKLTQTFGAGEVYKVAMLGLFYNPVTYQFSVDNGANWFPITIGINNANTSINLPSASQQLAIQGIILEDNSVISAIDIVPVYTQTPYYTSTIINYLSDPKVNQLYNRDPATLKPLFQLSTELHPLQYDITQLMNITRKYSLD